MRQKMNSGKAVKIILPAAIVLVVCVALGIVLIPPAHAYRSAMNDSRSLPFDEARDSLDAAIRKLEGNPLFAEKRAELLTRRGELIVSHAIGESETLPYEQALETLDEASELLGSDADGRAALADRRGELIVSHAIGESETLPYEKALEVLDEADALLGSDADRRAALADRRCELIYQHAAEESETLPYAEARALLLDAIAALDASPAYREALNARLDARTDAEIRRAIEAGEAETVLRLFELADADSLDDYRRQLYTRAEALLEAGDLLGAVEAFLALGTYADAAERVEAIREDLRFEEAAAVFTGNNYGEAVSALYALGTERGDAAAQALLNEREARRADAREIAGYRLAAGAWHTVWIENGRIRSVGDARFPETDAEADRVYSGLGAAFGLKDGSVIPLGETFGAEDALLSLHDVTDMGIGLTHAILLRADGTVTGVGSKAFGRVDTEAWTDIIGVAAGAWHSVGLRADGTVLSAGDDSFGQCGVSDWSEIVAVRAGLWHTVGLKADGTVVACGDDSFGQCGVSDWTEIIAIDCGACFTVGLKADGSVVACGDNAAGQCGVSDWTEIVAVAAGAYHTAAVRTDGTLCSAGRTPSGPLPETPIFASDRVLSPIANGSGASGTATAYIEGTDRERGPWLYLDEHGAVLICIDDSEPRTPFRVDMLATANALPGGRVTDPDAKGSVVYMPTEMVEKQARNAHAVVAFTGDYLGFTSNRKAVMIRDGVVYYDRDETTSLAILPDGTLAYYGPGETNAEALLSRGVKDSFSFGPLLVKDGAIALANDPRYTSSHTMRVGFGYSDPYHYLAIVTLRDRSLNYTIRMTAETLVRYGARLAYNLDGGHSTALTFMGNELSMVSLSGTPHTNIRSLSDVVVFLTSELVQPLE